MIRNKIIIIILSICIMVFILEIFAIIKGINGIALSGVIGFFGIVVGILGTMLKRIKHGL